MYLCVYSNIPTWEVGSVPQLQQDCSPEGKKNMFPLAATDAGVILAASKLNLYGFKAVAEEHYFKISLILCPNRALSVFCTDHSFEGFF